MLSKPTPLAVIVDNIPAVLTREHRWLVWRYEWRSPKWTKVPYRPYDAWIRSQSKAKATDPSTWTSFGIALRAYDRGYADGIGFVLGDGWVGFDQDDNLDLTYFRCLDTYTEVSPSGKGLHAIARGVKPADHCRTAGYELYDHSRYFTVTGHRVVDLPATVEPRTEHLAVLHSLLFPSTAISTGPIEPRQGPGDGNDDVLLAQMAGAPNGDKFLRLWRGQWKGYPSQSEADSALVFILAFWIGTDAERIDRLFRRSGLMRGKWDELRGQRTYGARVIDHALRAHRRSMSSSRPLSGLQGIQGLRGL